MYSSAIKTKRKRIYKYIIRVNREVNSQNIYNRKCEIYLYNN